MAKKKPLEDTDEAQSAQTNEPSTPIENGSQKKTDSGNGLMEEIQTFMSMRDELAQKLAAEIEETERKLEELRNTAASLFPQAAKSAVEKKAKKPKAKPTKEDNESDAASEG
jgi:hypothetical protein